MDDEKRRSVYRNSDAPSSSSARVEHTLPPPDEGTDVRRLPSGPPFDDRSDWRDPSRRVLLDDRTFRDHFADRRVERVGMHPYPPIDHLPPRFVRHEYTSEVPVLGTSGSPRYSMASRPIYRQAQYTYTDQPKEIFRAQPDYYGHVEERPSYTSNYSYPGHPENAPSQRDRSALLHSHVYEPVAYSHHAAPSYRDQGLRNDSSPHRSKRARVDPYFDGPHYSAAEEMHLLPLQTSSQYRSVAKSADRSESTDPRRVPEQSSMNEMWQRDAVNRERPNETQANNGVLRRQRSYSSSSSSQDGAPESTGDASVDRIAASSRHSTVKRRKRAVLSCTECKQRKIKCDRNVPNCGSCVRRGVAHLCRWGDERDLVPAKQSSNVTPSNAALMARIAQLESHVRVLQSTAPSASSDPQLHTSVERLRAQRATVGAPYDVFSSQTFRIGEGPPNFTSRESGIKPRHIKRDARSSTMAKSETSDQSDSTGEQATREVLHSTVKPTSLEAMQQQRFGIKGENSASVPEIGEGERPTTADSNKLMVLGERHDEAKASQSPGLFVLGAVTGLSQDWDVEKIHAEMILILRLLPSPKKTEAIVHFYLREAEPIINSIHVPSFLLRLEKFWREYGQAQRKELIEGKPVIPDAQFAALLLAMIEGACEYMTPDEVVGSGLCSSRDMVSAQQSLLSRSCIRLLGMDQFIRRPRITGLQAIVALRSYCFNRTHMEEYLVLLQMAMKAAENIGLHRLGSALKDEERWAAQDKCRRSSAEDLDSVQGNASAAHPFQRKAILQWRSLVSTKIDDANSDSDSENDESGYIRRDLGSMWLPRGSQRTEWETKVAKQYSDGSRVEREAGRKVWFALVTLDWQCAAHFDCCYHGSDDMFTTQSPQNIDDEDIIDDPEADALQALPGHAKTPSFLDKIRAQSVPTVNSFVPIHIEICHTVRSIADALNRGDESLETVATIEARFRSTLSSLPRFFRLDGESEYDPRIHQLHRDRPYLSFQRAVIHEHVHQRLLKLHRLLMTRGYRNTKYIHSTRTCIEGARVVLSILNSLDQVGCRGHKYWLFKAHIIHAVLALQVDLLYLARRPVDQEIEAKRAAVIVGLKMLHARTNVDGKNPILATALKVVKGLREEELSRRSRDAASADGSGLSSAEDRHDSRSLAFGKKSRGREWTRASESTGELAEHLGRRIRDTWSTVDPSQLRCRLPSVGSATPLDSLQQDSVSTSDSRFTGNTASLETSATGDSTANSSSDRGGATKTEPIETTRKPIQEFESHADRGDTDLDGYLELLTSYQNPQNTPGGSKLFDMLDDKVFDNASMTKLTFGALTPTDADLSAATRCDDNKGMLRDDTDLAAAGAGFDGFTTSQTEVFEHDKLVSTPGLTSNYN